MGGLTRVSQPGIEPVTVSRAKEHLEVEDSDWDDLLPVYISSARSAAEAFLKMSLMATPWEYRIDQCFPWEIRLPVGPVFDPTVSPASFSIDYVDDAGDTQTLATTEYQVSYGETAVIRPAYAKTWPVTRPVMDAVTIEFVAGWEDRDDIPPAIIHAILLMIADMFAQRENTVAGTMAEIPISARNLMIPFVRHD